MINVREHRRGNNQVLKIQNLNQHGHKTQNEDAQNRKHYTESYTYVQHGPPLGTVRFIKIYPVGGKSSFLLNCLLFRITWVHPRFLVGFVLFDL